MTQVLLAGVDVGVPRALDEGAKTTSELAAATGTVLERLERRCERSRLEHREKRERSLGPHARG